MHTPWDVLQLAYFIGYALWNYLTTPFLFTYPGVKAREIEPSHEAGQTWRRPQVTFPGSIATQSPRQVFYFDADGLQRRIDYVTEPLGSVIRALTRTTSLNATAGAISYDEAVTPNSRQLPYSRH